MKLYDKYKAVDQLRAKIVDTLAIGPMTEGEVMEEFNMARSKANWLLNKMTNEGYLLKVMRPDATKRKIAYYKASGMEFVVRTDAEIKEFFVQRSEASKAVISQSKENFKPIAGGKVYRLLDRKKDWDNPKPKRKTVVAIGSSFSLY